ncbi:MAG: macro domain-containing protein [Anaerolineales bacterium]
MNQVIQTHIFDSGQMLELVQGDITQEQVDAIVNAANEHLQHGGGVAGIISRKGGPQIQAESNAWVKAHGPVTHAEPAYTSAGNLPSRYIIHAVGPVWGQGDEDRKLAQAIQGSLKRAQSLELQSLALPAISTGIFGFPKPRAAKVILSTIREYFDHNPQSGLRQVRVVLYDRSTQKAFEQAWQDQDFGEEG